MLVPHTESPYVFSLLQTLPQTYSLSLSSARLNPINLYPFVFQPLNPLTLQSSTSTPSLIHSLTHPPTHRQRAMQLSFGFTIAAVFVIIPTMYTFSKNSRKVVQPHKSSIATTSVWQQQLYDDRLALRERVKVLKQMELEEEQQQLKSK